MKNRKFILISPLLIIGLISLVYAYRDFPIKLSGHFMISGENWVDPPPGHPLNTHFYVQLDGESAETLWKALDVEPKEDLCLGDGSKLKEVRNVKCSQSKEGKDTTCYFGVDIEKQKLVNATAC